MDAVVVAAVDDGDGFDSEKIDVVVVVVANDSVVRRDLYNTASDEHAYNLGLVDKIRLNNSYT